MTIPTADIHDCPQHGLFANPDYWPCPFCFERKHIKKGPMVWNTTFVLWNGVERSLTLDFIPTDDQKYKDVVVFRRVEDKP